MSKEMKFRVRLTELAGSKRTFIHHYTMSQMVARAWDAGRYDYEILGQYTGLKDKNGVEIYEGDVVNRWSSPYRIVWSQRDCKFMLEIIYSEPLEGIRQTHEDFPLDGLGIVVIVNIHKKPELL